MRFLLLLLVPLALAVGSRAQSIETLGDGGYHPVTENGRVLWLEGDAGPDALRLRLWDGTTTTTLDEQASGAFPGWPDLDAAGRVAYVKAVGGRYELMLWDGRTTRQLTHTNVPGSAVELGTPTSERKGGFARIAGGDVVFADVNGDVYLYESDGPRIRRLTERPDQRVVQTTQDYRAVMQQTGIKPVFYFDGRYIVWMHQALGGQTSDFTVYQADTEHGAAPRALTTFTASTPRSEGEVTVNAVVAGLGFDPYFVACGPEVAWMYRALGQVDPDVPARYAALAAAQTGETVIGYYDGTGVREVARGALQPLSLDLSDGHLVWVEEVERGDTDQHLVQRHEGGTTTPLAAYDAPPADAPAGARFWTSPAGLRVEGSEVLWFMDQVECQKMAINLPGLGAPCAYVPTQRAAVFTGDAPRTPRYEFAQGAIVPGGTLSGGRYAWRAFDFSIRTAQLVEGTGSGAGLLYLADRLTPNRLPLRADDPRTRLVDRFGLRSAGGGECAPGEAGVTAEVTAVTFSVSADAGVLPELDDITGLALYLDVDRDRRRSPADQLLAETTTVGARQRMVFADPVTVLPDEEALFLVEMTLKDADQLCPCNRYVVALAGADVETNDLAVQGRTEGGLVLPAPTFAAITGDAQVGVPGARLADPLGVELAMPARCAAVRYTLRDVPGGDTPRLIGPDGTEGREIEVALEDTDDGARAEAHLQLGTAADRYHVETTLVFPEGSRCRAPAVSFLAQAGEMVLQVIDANDPAFVTAEPDDSHQPEYRSWTVSLTDDLEALATGGEHRTRVSADGASPLLLRARLLDIDEAPAGPVTFSLSGAGATGHLSPGLGETLPVEGGSAQVVTEWTLTADGPVAVALYTPPRDFADAQAAGRTLTFTVTFEPASGGEAVERTQEVELIRPPVLFVHGMWSDPGTWKEPYRAHDTRYDTYWADYRDKAAWSFATLGHVVEGEVQRALADRRARGIATTQVDLVGHSMGGLITRQFIDDNHGLDYRRADNFGRGDLHKFITMGTPHWGSPIAWLTLWLAENEATQFTFLGYVDGLGIDIYSGAVEAMCPGSPQLQQLGRTHVPSHTIRAWHLDSMAPDFSWGTLYDFLGALWDAQPTPMGLVAATLQFGGELALETGIQGLYSSDKTDYLVTLESQGGGILQGRDHLFPETMHVGAPTIYGETTSPDVAAYVFGLLEQPVDDTGVFAPSLPPPAVDPTDPVSCAAPD